MRGEGLRAPECGSQAAGFVLAGGESSRMGADKALVKLVGKTLVQHALAILREAGLSAAIGGARSALGEFAPVVEDRTPGRGPLAGVCAALSSTSAPWAAILSIDLPLVPPSLIRYMLDRARVAEAAAVIPSVSGFSQTFPAIVARAALPVLVQELEAGRSGCLAAFRSTGGRLGRRVLTLPIEVLAQPGHVTDERGLPPAFWFSNVNTPTDLERAGRILALRIA